MKAKCISVTRPETENGSIVVFSFVKANERNTLGSKLFSAVLNGENATYFLPMDAKALTTLSDTDKVSDSELQTIRVEFENQIIDEIGLFDFSVHELFENIRGFKVNGNEAIQPITVFHRASFESKENAQARLIAQIQRQVADGSLIPVKEGEE